MVPHVQKSTFYKLMKTKFGPRRDDKDLPCIRISKYSTHSRCDICVGLDQLARTCGSGAELERAKALKKNHVSRYSNARIEINRLIQLGITHPREYVTFMFDGMDNSKSYLPRILEKSKKLTGIFKLPSKIIGCITISSLYQEKHRKVNFFVNHDHFEVSLSKIHKL